MSYKQAHIDIEHYFADQWALGTYSAYAIKYENVASSKPGNAPWLRFTIIDGQSSRLQVGASPQREYSGMAVINIFCLPDTSGTNLIRAMMDAVVSILAAVNISGNEFDDHEATVNGIIDGWLQATVTFPFTRIE